MTLLIIAAGKTLWLVLALAGAIIQAMLWIDSWRDLDYMQRNEINGPRQHVAEMHVTRDWFRFLVLVLLGVAGFVLLVLPAQWNLRTADWIAGMLQLAVILLIDVKAFQDRHRRWELIDMLRRRERG